jgi:hypothetical protein
MLSFGPARMYPYYCNLKTGKTIRQERKLGWSLGIFIFNKIGTKIAKKIYRLTQQISAGDLRTTPASWKGKSFEHSIWSHTVPWQLVERRHQWVMVMVRVRCHVNRIGLWENFNRKALYLMVKTMVSCNFSLKPIQ